MYFVMQGDKVLNFKKKYTLLKMNVGHGSVH